MKFLTVLLFLTLANVHPAQAEDVHLYGGLTIEGQSLFRLVCTSDQEMEKLLDVGQITTYNQSAFLTLREITRENLKNPLWFPQSYMERSDYCALTETLLLVKKSCEGVSQERLIELNAQLCGSW